MNNLEKSDGGRLVPAGTRNLAPVAAVNPLVLRGLADLAFPSSPQESLIVQGFCTFLDGLLDEAIILFDEALRWSPDDHNEVYNWRGQAWLRKWYVSSISEHVHNAIRDFSKAIWIEPDASYSFELRGLALYLNRDYVRATDDFSEAIRIDHSMLDDYSHPSDFWGVSLAESYFCRGIASISKGDYDAAIRDFNESARFGADVLVQKSADFAFRAPLWVWLRGIIRHSQGDLEKVIEELDQAARLQRRHRPTHEPTLKRLGMLSIPECISHACVANLKAVQCDINKER